MRERRWPWMVTSVLLLAAAVATAWSTYLHWLPCRGTLLSGSVVRNYRYGPDFSDACLRRMDTGLPYPYPPEPAEQALWASELAVVAMALVGAAWLVLLLSQRWSLRTTAVAALPGLATLMLTAIAAVATADAGRSADEYLSLWLWLAPDAAALVALAAIWRWQPEDHGRGFARVVVVAWGTTAFGFIHAFGEYGFMVGFSDANWDTPPLTGYLTVATILLAAVLTVILTVRSPPQPRESEIELPSAAAHATR